MMISIFLTLIAVVFANEVLHKGMTQEKSDKI